MDPKDAYNIVVAVASNAPLTMEENTQLRLALETLKAMGMNKEDSDEADD